MTERIVRIGVPREISDEIAQSLDSNDFITKRVLKQQIDDLINAPIKVGVVDADDVLHLELREFEGLETHDVFRPVWTCDMREENNAVFYYYPPNVWNRN